MDRRPILMMAVLCGLGGCEKATPAPQLATSTCGSPQGKAVALDPSGGGPEADRIPAGEAKERMAVVTSSGEIADVVSLLSWQLCNARTASWIDDNFYRTEMTLLRQSAFEAFAERAGRSPGQSAMARQTACLAQAGNDANAQAACKAG
jgi:hypothetical protein